MKINPEIYKLMPADKVKKLIKMCTEMQYSHCSVCNEKELMDEMAEISTGFCCQRCAMQNNAWEIFDKKEK